MRLTLDGRVPPLLIYPLGGTNGFYIRVQLEILYSPLLSGIDSESENTHFFSN